MPVVVLVVAAGAAWESAAMRALTETPGVVVLKRCVDVADLLAAASAGQADVAVLGLDAPGLDLAATDHLRRHGVRPVAIVPAGPDEAGRLRASRVGIPWLVAEDRLGALGEAVTASPEPVEETRPRGEEALPPLEEPDPSGPAGRVVAVWGPAGAPGRTTLAVALAAELARRRLMTVLVDADPYAASVAQALGVLDEVSGLLSAARLAAAGQLADRFSSVRRGLDAHLSVVTGLPRADRWSEVRAGAVEHLLEVAREHGHVVVDTGFSLEEDPAADLGPRPGRNQLTLGSLEVADEVVVVGGADPVGLSRLARGLVELRELGMAGAPHVVVNRMRPSLGWSEKDVSAMVAGFTRTASLHFLPEDRVTADRALVTGRTLTEVGDSPLARAVAGVADALVGPVGPPGAEPRRTSRGRGAARLARQAAKSR
ncbi:MAG: AAA family ATPase [Nocardioides sp.]